MANPRDTSEKPKSTPEILLLFREAIFEQNRCADCLNVLSESDCSVCGRCGHDHFADKLEFIDDEPV